MPVISLGAKTGNAAHTKTLVQCGRYAIRPSSIESISDAFTPFAPNSKHKVVIHTIGGKTHEEEFDTAELAEAYHVAVTELAFG